MPKQKIRVTIIVLIVTASVILSGCTTAQSRRQNSRIEDLERRVAKIELDTTGDLPSSDDNLSRYLEMARATR